MAPAVQAKLLRVMQEKEFRPLGAVDNRKVDVRILAATNEDIRKLVDEGIFREDLYYRLNVLNMTLPPLRNAHGGPAAAVDRAFPPAVQRRRTTSGSSGWRLRCSSGLLSYSWPGNVRELENVIERGVVLARGPEITVDLLAARATLR